MYTLQETKYKLDFN